MGIESTRAMEPKIAAVHGMAPELKEQFRAVSKEYLSDAVAKTIIKVATRPPPDENFYPHHTVGDDFAYKYEPVQWWTAGFFPGSIWQLYQRSLRVPQALSSDELLGLALKWQKGLEQHQYNKDTHDLGFLILPSFYSHYKNCNNLASRDIVINAAKSLSSRWSETVQSLRSWDECVTKRFNFTNKDTDFLVIADNMMNLDLLYLGSELTGDPEYARRATIHAKTTLLHQLRPDYSTYHLVNFDPDTGAVKGRYTVQGYEDESCWARGQAWALYGYATAYRFTRDAQFLEASTKLSEYFCRRVNEIADPEQLGAVFWDFDSPRPPAILDTSASMIACSGLLLLYQLTGLPDFLPTVIKIMQYTARKSRLPESADTIIGGATVNNNKDSKTPVAETGLVYADYYFLEVGNRLIDLGLV